MTGYASQATTPKQPSFWTRLTWLGRRGKTKYERLQDFPEVVYQSTAIGYEHLEGRSGHERQSRSDNVTHSRRHAIQSVGGQRLVNGTCCHEYLAMDSMGYSHEYLEKEMNESNIHMEYRRAENTDQLIGFEPSRFLFPNMLRVPSFWFWFARVFTGFMASISYIMFVAGGTILNFFMDGTFGAKEYFLDFYNWPFTLYMFGLTPFYYLFFKVLHLTGIANLFDPPFISGYALRRDLGTLRGLNKKGEVHDIPFQELEARTTTMWDGGNRAMCKLYLSHKYSKEGVIYGAPHKPAFYVGILWEFFQHFMDVSRPLPDIPELEPYRHLDPTTRAWDKAHNRPERLWRDMPRHEYLDLVEASLDAAESYPYLQPDAVKKQKWSPAGDGQHWYQRG